MGIFKSISNFFVTRVDTHLDIEIYHSISEVNEDWDTLVKGKSLFLQRSYLLSIEEAALKPAFRYAVLYDGKHPVGVVYMQFINFNWENFGSNEQKDIERNGKARCFGKKALRRLPLCILICGNPYVSGQHGFVFNDSISSEVAYDGLAAAIRKVRKAYKGLKPVLGILVKDFERTDFESSCLIKRRYYEFEADNNMVFHLNEEWNDYNDYLEALSSKYRVRAKNIEKKSSALIKKDLTIDELRTNIDRLKELYLNVHNKASFRLGTFNVESFIGLKDCVDSFFVRAYYLNDKIVGFTSGFSDENVLETFIVGLDYSYHLEHAIYSTILYDYVRFAIQRKVRIISYGRTANEIKSTVGAVPKGLKCYIQTCIPLTDKIINPFVGYLKADPWIQRNPFRIKNEIEGLAISEKNNQIIKNSASE